MKRYGWLLLALTGCDRPYSPEEAAKPPPQDYRGATIKSVWHNGKSRVRITMDDGRVLCIDGYKGVRLKDE